MIEIVADENNRCGEAPIWDLELERLIWSDLSSKLVYQFVLGRVETSIICRGLMVSGLALNRTGELVFASDSGLYLWSERRSKSLVTEYNGELLSFNDLIADPQGRVYAGTLYLAPDGVGIAKLGRLYIINRDGTTRVVDEPFEISNGLGFSPDNKTLYHTDSALRTIYAYEVEPETGELVKKRVFVKVPREEGVPDGLTVDADGFVWSAQWFGAQIVRYDPEGKVERRIALPVQQVSSLAFGGDSLTDLYVTTASEPWNSPLAPPSYDFSAPNMGGSLYRVHLDIQGKPEHYAALGKD